MFKYFINKILWLFILKYAFGAINRTLYHVNETLDYFFKYQYIYPNFTEMKAWFNAHFCENQVMNISMDPELCYSLSTMWNFQGCFYRPDIATNCCFESYCWDLPIDKCHYVIHPHSDQYYGRLRLCELDKATNKCYPYLCEEMPVERCFDFPKRERDNCLPNLDNTGCETKSCNQLTPDRCYIFNTTTNYSQCIPTDNNDGCFISNCTNLTQQCHRYRVESDTLECGYNETIQGCQIQLKPCEDLSAEYCGEYNKKFGYREEKCFPDKNNQKCQLKSCRQLPKEECSNFDVFLSGDQTKCLPSGENCALIECDNLDEEQCNSRTFEDKGYKCKYNKGEGKCEIDSCYSLNKDNCNEFVPSNPLFKCAKVEESCKIEERTCEGMDIDKCSSFQVDMYDCVLDSGKGSCQLQLKQCDQLPNNFCEQYNALRGIFDEKCTPDSESEKCQLHSCSALSKDKCTDFNIYLEEYENLFCVPEGEKCSVQSCPDLEEGECLLHSFEDDGYKCIYKEEGGCTMDSCYFLSEDKCNQFEPNNHLYRCAASEGKCHLEKKKCEDMPPVQCSLYEDILYECTLDEKTHVCHTKLRSCEQMPADSCHLYNVEYKNLEHICLPSEESDKCELMKCSDLSKDECDIFNNYIEEEGNVYCVPDGEACAIKTCSDFNETECKLMSKCIYEKGSCSANLCYTPNIEKCNEIQVKDSYYNCKEVDGECTLQKNRCEDMDYDKCTLFKGNDITKKCLRNTKTKKCNYVFIGNHMDKSDYLIFSFFNLLLLLFFFIL